MSQKEERWIEFEACRQIDEDEKVPTFDLFGDPDPFETFQFNFTVNRNSSSSNNNNNNNSNNKDKDNNIDDNISPPTLPPKEISIKLKGYKHSHERIFDSTGLTLWRASKLLCHYICNNPQIIQNKYVIELGSGLGLCGLLVYCMGGARSVVMTDGDTDVLKEMRCNVYENLKSTFVSSSDSGSGSSVSDNNNNDNHGAQEKRILSLLPCHQLLWGKEKTQTFKEEIIKSIISNSSKQKTSSSTSTATTFTAEEEEEMDGFDVIIASDVIYVDYILDDLFDTITTLFSSSKKKDAKAYIGYARRAVDIQLVFDCAERHGLNWIVPNDGDGDGDGNVGEGVYVFSRR